MGHEWWGNWPHVADWSDFWIHEGFDTYSEALFIEEKYGWDKAVGFVKDRFKNNIKNEFPIIMGENGTSHHPSGNDVYYIGAHILHMLRYIIGDKVFKSSLKRVYRNAEKAWRESNVYNRVHISFKRKY